MNDTSVLMGHRHWVAFAYLGGGCMHGDGRLLSHELVVAFMQSAEQVFSRAERLSSPHSENTEDTYETLKDYSNSCLPELQSLAEM